MSKFHVHCQSIKDWLTEEHCPNPNEILIKLCLYIKNGITEPEFLVAKALQDCNIRQAAIGDTGNVDNTVILPVSVANQIRKLILILSKNEVSLSDVYERLVTSRKLRGTYYTPHIVVDYIVKHTVEKLNVLEDPFIRVLDPACGCGNFLIKAYDVLYDKFSSAREQLAQLYPDKDWSDRGIHVHILTHNLWGADIDTVAVDITVASLILKQPRGGPCSTNIIVCDSLLYHGNEAVAHEHWNFWAQRYDCVIGNPPYLSFGLRGAGRLDKGYYDYLRRNFSASAEYKLSYYVLFMEQGIDRLVEGGYLGFIVPDSFLLGRYYSKIRSYIMEKTSIEALVHIETSLFGEVTTGFCAICILRKNRQSLHLKQQVKVFKVTNTDEFPAEPVQIMDQSYFASLPFNRFRLYFNDTAKRIIDKLEKVGLPLGVFASGHTGIRSLTKQSDIISSDCKGDTWHRGIISGSQLCRYNLRYDGHWLNIDALLLHKGGWRKDIVSQRKMLVRQTGYSLTAAIDNEGYFHLNNIHSFILTSGEVSLDYLILLFNSRLFSFYYHITSMEYGRSMAQTDIETLELLPVRVNADINRQAADLVKAMTTCFNLGLKGDKQAMSRCQAIDDYIDQIVYRIYELSDDEVQYVERYESATLGKGNKQRNFAND